MLSRISVAAGIAVTLIFSFPHAYAQDGKQVDMPLISGGAFIMGSEDGRNDEKPQHRLVLPAFLIDLLPVTNAAFADFLNAKGWRNAAGRRYYDVDDGDARIHRLNGKLVADSGYGSHAMVEPSWIGAVEYCGWRSKRLPTEAEWERAARGLVGRTYPWGNAKPDRNRARYASGWNETAPVGAHPSGATLEGVMGFAGNTHEWTSSLYRPYPWSADDGRESLNPDAAGERVTRGGAHDNPGEMLRSAWRGDGVSRNPRAGHHNIGFRCARDAEGS